MIEGSDTAQPQARKDGFRRPLKPEKERPGMQPRTHAHLHDLRAAVPCQPLLRGVDHRDLHQGVQLPITDRSHQILARWQRQSKEKEKKLTPSLRANFCLELEVNFAAAALKEISGESGRFFFFFCRGSPLEVPYRNRKSRAAELN